MHYGDTTLTFLNNWYRADQRGTALTYVSAVGRRGEVGHRLQLGQPRRRARSRARSRRPPQVPLVAIYPKEGTLFSDNPLLRDRRRLGDARAAEGAGLFAEFVQPADEQERVLEFGFRPGNPDVAIAAPITPDQRCRPRPARDAARGARRRA